MLSKNSKSWLCKKLRQLHPWNDGFWLASNQFQASRSLSNIILYLYFMILIIAKTPKKTKPLEGVGRLVAIVAVSA